MTVWFLFWNASGILIGIATDISGKICFYVFESPWLVMEMALVGAKGVY